MAIEVNKRVVQPVDQKFSSKGNDSVHDVAVRNAKADTLSRNISMNKDVIKDNAKRKVTSAAEETVKGVVVASGGSKSTARQVTDVLKYGKKSKDSILNLATKGIDTIFGTNTNTLLNEFLPSNYAESTEPSDPPPYSPNSIAAKMDMRSDPLMNFNWVIELPELPNVQNLDMNIFNFYVEDVNLVLPHFSVESAFRNGTHIPYPKFSDTGSMTVIFYEDDNLNTTTYLQAWQYLIQDPITGFYGRPAAYKKPIKVTLLDAANIPCGTFTVESGWPTQITGHHFTSGPSEAKTVTCEFALNRVTYEPFAERAQMIAARPMRSQGISAASIRNANLQDIFENPIEFGKAVLGIKSKITKKSSPIIF